MRKMPLVVGIACLTLLFSAESGLTSEDVLDQHASRVSELFDHGNFADAVPVAREMLKIFEARYLEDSLDVAMARSALAVAHLMLNNLDEAEPLLLKALPVYEKHVGSNDAYYAVMLQGLGACRARVFKFEEAEALFRKAVQIQEAVLGADNNYLGTAYYNLGVILTKAGKYAQARDPLTKALKIKEKALGPEHPKLDEVLTALSWALWRTDDRGKATEYEDRARRLRASVAAKAPESPELELTPISK